MNSMRDVVRFVAIANLLYFFVEFFFALKLGSVSLFADSIDFLEDASVNILIFIGLSWSLVARQHLSRVLAVLLVIPAIFVASSVIYELNSPSVPSGKGISLVASGALVVNFSCALLLTKFRKSNQNLILAAYLSARNDALANIAIIVAGITTLFWVSAVPDLAVGVSIGMLNASAAIKVWRGAELEQDESHRP